MTTRLFLTPWMRGLVQGALFGTLVGVWAFLDDEGWPAVGLLAVGGGLFFWAFVTWTARRDLARWRRVVGFDLDDEQLKTVHRAVTKGPVPSDPRLRAAARDAALHDLSRSDEPWARVAFLLAFPVLVVVNVIDSWWWLVLIPVYLVGAYQAWATPRRLRARVELLTRSSA